MIVALVVLSIEALAHFHFGSNAGDETHCTLCMVTHNASHALIPSIPAISFQPTCCPAVIDSAVLAFLFEPPLLVRDRAPPAF